MKKFQGYLRKKLFKSRTSSICSCCGKEYPISMLWCSHIKKRSKCNDNEKRDYNVVIPMCRFGCDELFEKGYISVNSDGKIIQLKKSKNTNVLNYTNNLNKLDCIGFNKLNSKYFEWHKSFHS